LAYAQRQAERTLIEIGLEAEALHELGDARSRLVDCEMEQTGVQFEILADRELRIE